MTEMEFSGGLAGEQTTDNNASVCWMKIVAGAAVGESKLNVSPMSWDVLKPYSSLFQCAYHVCFSLFFSTIYQFLNCTEK